MFQRLKRWVMDNSAALTVVSRAMKKTVVDMGVAADKVQVIPMGVDLKNNFIPDITVLRKTDELLFVGRLVEKRGGHDDPEADESGDRITSPVRFMNRRMRNRMSGGVGGRRG
jgi:glycosyltransferase involved in cell wall biosynthesis